MLRDDWIDASRIRPRQSIARIHRETALQIPQSRSYRRTYGAFFMVQRNVAHEDLNKRVTSRNSYSERQAFQERWLMAEPSRDQRVASLEFSEPYRMLQNL